MHAHVDNSRILSRFVRLAELTKDIPRIHAHRPHAPQVNGPGRRLVPTLWPLRVGGGTTRTNSTPARRCLAYAFSKHNYLTFGRSEDAPPGSNNPCKPHNVGIWRRAAVFAEQKAQTDTVVRLSYRRTWLGRHNLELPCMHHLDEAQRRLLGRRLVPKGEGRLEELVVAQWCRVYLTVQCVGRGGGERRRGVGGPSDGPLSWIRERVRYCASFQEPHCSDNEQMRVNASGPGWKGSCKRHGHRPRLPPGSRRGSMECSVEFLMLAIFLGSDARNGVRMHFGVTPCIDVDDVEQCAGSCRSS